MKNNVIGWIEVPVENMQRAIKFYEAVFEFKIERHEMCSVDMGWFPWIEDGTGSGGSLVKSGDYYKPSTDGVLIYFTAHSGDLSSELARIEPAGGKVLQPKTRIAEGYGYYALFLDSEGNRVALHSRD